MKGSEYLLNYLKEKGVNHAFLITGGSIAPTIDSFDSSKNLEYICTTNEQGAAIAAEAYSRVSGKLGVAMSTSGPGATNLVTGIACAYFDSIPTLYITGQVNDYESTWKNGPRQVGFQETNIVGMVKPITKYASRVNNLKELPYELEKAIHIATSGRPGPVLLDLPFNTQHGELKEEEIKHYSPKKTKVNYKLLNEKVDEVINLLKNSERPVIIAGSGIKLGNAKKKTRTLVEKLGIPVVETWGAIDFLPYDHPLFVEGFGVSHNRAGNFTVQNSDLLISLGARLDTRETGGKRSSFARGAKKVVVDIDKNELYKDRGMNIDVGIDYDLNDFVDTLLEKSDNIKIQDISNWKEIINDWKQKFPIVQPEYLNQSDKVNPYVFMESLSKESKEGDIIIADTGANLMWTMQGWKTKEDQKIFSAFGHSPMGYSLPASIGASFASNKGPITCIIGDGGIKMNINELETLVRHKLPIKIFLINNHELGTIKQFQDTLFNSRYKASSIEGGLGDTDLLTIGKAYGLDTVQINNHKEMNSKIKEVFDNKNPTLCSVELRHGEKVIPKVEFGRPIEDPTPLLDRDEFNKIMIVPPIK